MIHVRKMIHISLSDGLGSCCCERNFQGRQFDSALSVMYHNQTILVYIKKKIPNILYVDTWTEMNCAKARFFWLLLTFCPALLFIVLLHTIRVFSSILIITGAHILDVAVFKTMFYSTISKRKEQMRDGSSDAADDAHADEYGQWLVRFATDAKSNTYLASNNLVSKEFWILIVSSLFYIYFCG